MMQQAQAQAQYEAQQQQQQQQAQAAQAQPGAGFFSGVVAQAQMGGPAVMVDSVQVNLEAQAHAHVAAEAKQPDLAAIAGAAVPEDLEMSLCQHPTHGVINWRMPARSGPFATAIAARSVHGGARADMQTCEGTALGERLLLELEHCRVIPHGLNGRLWHVDHHHHHSHASHHRLLVRHSTAGIKTSSSSLWVVAALLGKHSIW